VFDAFVFARTGARLTRVVILSSATTTSGAFDYSGITTITFVRGRANARTRSFARTKFAPVIVFSSHTSTSRTNNDACAFARAFVDDCSTFGFAVTSARLTRVVRFAAHAFTTRAFHDTKTITTTFVRCTGTRRRTSASARFASVVVLATDTIAANTNDHARAFTSVFGNFTCPRAFASARLTRVVVLTTDSIATRTNEYFAAATQTYVRNDFTVRCTLTSANGTRRIVLTARATTVGTNNDATAQTRFAFDFWHFFHIFSFGEGDATDNEFFTFESRHDTQIIFEIVFGQCEQKRTVHTIGTERLFVLR